MKAAGDLSPQAIAALEGSTLLPASADDVNAEEAEKSFEKTQPVEENQSLEAIDIETYKPTILPNRAWKLTELDLGKHFSSCVISKASSDTITEWIAEGCGVLGTGGGGSPYPPFLMARQALRDGKEIFVSFANLPNPNLVTHIEQVLDPDDVPEQDVFIRCGFMVWTLPQLARHVAHVTKLRVLLVSP